jgi:hypothetical protein
MGKRLGLIRGVVLSSVFMDSRFRGNDGPRMICVVMYNISHDRQKYGSRIVQRAFVQTAKNRQLNDVVTIISMDDVLNVVT